MGLDGITLSKLKRELQDGLTGGWVRKIYQPRPELVTVNVWNDEDYRLLISCGENFRIQLTELELENPETPPSFTMLLRKHLSGGKIARITQERGLDRIIRISVDKQVEEADEKRIERKEIYIELMGRNSNLYLVQDGEILGVLRERKSRNRDTTPGGRYELPPGQDKLDPFELTQEEFFDFTRPDDPIWRNLLNGIDGIGPTLAREVPTRAGIPDDRVDLSESERESLWEAAEELFDELSSRDFTPRVYQDDGIPVEFSPVRLESFADKEELTYNSLSRALDHYYKARETSFETVELREKVEDTIEEELDRVEGALKNVKDQLEQSRNRKELKRTGDIILANLAELEKGMEAAELADPYNEGEKKKIDLDPSKTPQENAERYYERYKKLERGKEKLEKRKRNLQKELDFLTKLEKKYEESENPEDLAKIEGILKEKGYIDEEVGSPNQGSRGGPKEYWIKGYKVMVGRNARQNDDLVREASRDDLWFHVRNYAGAHVVVVTDGRPDQVPEEVIIKAAQLAAANSKARGAERTSVSYTEVRYVDKPKGAKPGLVQITNEHTVNVSPKEVIS
ncbi:MAG: Rqc2 family fibronectin-binding protein [Candidatus Bipolaricaulota bacterium]